MWAALAAPGWPAATGLVESALVGRPTVALLVASVGVVLLLAEFHRPGWVVPGAVGTALLLLGGYGLAMQPVRWWAVGMLVLATGLLVLPWRRPEWAAVAMTAGLVAGCVGLTWLVRSPTVGWVPMAVLDGAVLGAACGGLATVAGRARRAKVWGRAGSGEDRSGGSGRGSGGGERWE